MKRISIRMKTTKHTRNECSRRQQMWMPYFQGRTKPHFPVPAIPTKVGFHFAHSSQMYPSGYWYVSNRNLLWTFFQKFGFIQRERV